MAGAMRERFAQVACELLDEDPRTMVLLADLSVAMFDAGHRRHPHRVINFGIREQLLIDAAGGAALAGARPIVHSFAPFLIERPFEQIKISLSHQGAGAVLVSAGASYDIASGGRTHQAPADVALISTLEGWTVRVPGHPDEVDGALRAAVRGESHQYVRLSVESNSSSLITDGRPMRLLKAGKRGTVIAIGPMADRTLAATEGWDVSVVYTDRAFPWPERFLRSVISAASPVVAVVEPYLEGTSLRELHRVTRGAPLSIEMIGVAPQELRNYGTSYQHAVAHGLDVAGIKRRLESHLGQAASSWF